MRGERATITHEEEARPADLGAIDAADGVPVPAIVVIGRIDVP